MLQLAQLLVLVIVLHLAAQRAAKLSDPLAKRTPQLGQPLGAEDDQGNDQDDQQLHWSDIGHRGQWYRRQRAGGSRGPDLPPRRLKQGREASIGWPRDPVRPVDP